MRTREELTPLIGAKVMIHTNWMSPDLIEGELVEVSSEGPVVDVSDLSSISAGGDGIPCPGRWLVTWPDVLDVEAVKEAT